MMLKLIMDVVLQGGSKMICDSQWGCSLVRHGRKSSDADCSWMKAWHKGGAKISSKQVQGKAELVGGQM